MKGLSSRPTAEELEVIAESGKPDRAIAIKILWHYYSRTK